jgi:hypothetical protein
MVSLAREVSLDVAVPDEIYLSSFSEAEDWKALEGVFQPWAAAQHALLRAGWTINHLIRLNDDVGRSLLLMESMLGLLSVDASYRALHSTSGAMPANVDYFVVPRHFALVRFDVATEGDQAVLLLRDQESVRALIENCRLLKDQMEPLIEAISRDDRQDFEARQLQAELIPAERVLVRDALSVPGEAAYGSERGWLPPVGLPSDDVLGPPSFSQIRRERFEATVRRYRIRYIYIKERIELLVATSREVGAGFLLDDGGERFQPARVRQALEQLLDLLKRYENFDVALLDADEVSLIQAPGSDSVVYWLVQGNELLLESWPRVASGEARHLHIAVHAASIAAAFMEHFRNVWARVNPAHHDKATVVRWLQEQADSLEPYT